MWRKNLKWLFSGLKNYDKFEARSIPDTVRKCDTVNSESCTQHSQSFGTLCEAPGVLNCLVINYDYKTLSYLFFLFANVN